MADTFVKNPVLLVGEKDEIVPQMGENDLGVATDVEFYTKQEVDDLVAQSGGASLPILLSVLSDYVLNDMSWLRSDTFSWQSGDVYVAAYNHLVADFEGTTAETETIADITIAFFRAEDGHKICMPDQESNVSELYETTGAADYYILDTTNKRFKLPRNYQPKRRLIRMANNADGTWYKLYSDGWVEQGGYDSTDFNTRTWTYPIAMSDTNYTLTLSVGYVNIDTQNGKFGVTSRTETGFSYKVISLGGNAVGDNMSWRVEGYSAVQGGGVQRKYEYYYVGNFTQEAIEQTAGITAEALNGKADTDLGNIPTNYDYVVESQLPTADNGYTWYRKYKNGWVEQGGLFTPKSASTGGGTIATITLPIEMSDDKYWWSANGVGSASAGAYLGVARNSTTSSTSLVLKGWCIVAQEASWHVVGYAA